MANDYCPSCGDMLPVDDEIIRLRRELREAEDFQAEFLEELDQALGLEDGEEARYSNPEGAAESIYIDVAAAYKRQLDEVREALLQGGQDASIRCRAALKILDPTRSHRTGATP